jgi:hypothetical protein
MLSTTRLCSRQSQRDLRKPFQSFTHHQFNFRKLNQGNSQNDQLQTQLNIWHTRRQSTVQTNA